jgi:hypothetical protein
VVTGFPLSISVCTALRLKSSSYRLRVWAIDAPCLG